MRGVAMRKTLEVANGKRVNYGQREERCADELNGGGVH